MTNTNTSKAIKIAMIEAEITVKEMAERLGKPESTISRWRNDGCNSVTALQEIAKACGMSMAELLEKGA